MSVTSLSRVRPTGEQVLQRIVLNGVSLTLDQAGEGATLAFDPAASGRPAWELPIGAPHKVLETRQVDGAIEADIVLFPNTGVNGHGNLRLTLRAGLTNDADQEHAIACDLALSCADPDFPMEDLFFPGPLSVTGDVDGSDWKYLLPYGEGILVHTDGAEPNAHERIDFHDYKITLPLVAALRKDGAAVMAITHQGHDHGVRPSYSSADERGVGFQMVQLASLGTWRYDRSWRIVSVPAGGVNALAKVTRHELRRSGIELRSLAQKVETLPAAHRAALGGTHLWCHMDTLTSGLVRNLEDSGIRSLLVLGRPADAGAMDAVREAGFASGPYFQTFDVYPAGTVTPLEWRNTYPPEGATDGYPEQLRRDREGFFDYAWVHMAMTHSSSHWQPAEVLGSGGEVARKSVAVHGEYPVQSYRRCQVFHREVIRNHALPLFERLGSTAVFYDICTTMLGLECFDPKHPCDRRRDVDLRREALTLVGGEDRILLSEDGKWWAVGEAHGFEGGLNYDGMESLDNITLTDYAFNESNWLTEFSLEHRVPFFSMVAGFTVASTFWWGRGQDRHVETRRAKDAFAALAGGNPIFVVDPTHPLEPGTPRWDEFVATARSFDQLRDHILGVPIERYEVHGRHHATTIFENGVTVTANVGPVPVQGLDAGEYRAVAPDGKPIAGNGSASTGV